MNKIIVTILLIIIIIGLAVFIFFFLIYDQSSPATETAGITDFQVARPDLVVTSAGLARVEIWAVPTGSGITEADYTKIGDAKLTSTTSLTQIWILTIPADPISAAVIFAKGFSSDGKATGEFNLPLSGETEIYNVLWGKAMINEYEINGLDSGKVFSYPMTSRFTLLLDSKTYPEASLIVKPAGIIGRVTDVATATPPLYAVRYEGAATGTAEIADKDFSVTIRIYNAATQAVKYDNAQFGFSFSYPPADYADKNPTYQFMTNNSLARIDLPANDYTDTNLGEAAFFAGASRDLRVVRQCLATSSSVENEKKLPGAKEINGLDFAQFNGLGAAAGNRYDMTSYRAVKNLTCYEFVLLEHYGEILNYPPGIVRIFDQLKITSALEVILDTVNIK